MRRLFPIACISASKQGNSNKKRLQTNLVTDPSLFIKPQFSTLSIHERLVVLRVQDIQFAF